MNSHLIIKQDLLQREAQEVLEKLDLLNLLKQFGEPHIVGSVKLGLMTWRDIDLEIIVNDLKKDDLLKIILSLFKQSHKRFDVTFMDHTNETSGQVPQGLYLGLNYYEKLKKDESILFKSEHTWKLDLWFVAGENARSLSQTKELEEKFNDENKQIILELKTRLLSNPKYRREIFSTDIYKAVLDNNVTNLKEFNSYIKSLGKDL